MTKRKIILIGSGAVGTAFLYSAMNQGLASEYGIIDLNEKFVDGNVLDFEDVSAAVEQPFHVYKASYKDCKTADIVVITAGRAQREGETRLDLVKDNAKIMKGIAQGVRKSGFQGITVIASNPVDLMTLVYQQVTGFDHKKSGWFRNFTRFSSFDCRFSPPLLRSAELNWSLCFRWTWRFFGQCF